jgi:hypothetical protein
MNKSVGRVRESNSEYCHHCPGEKETLLPADGMAVGNIEGKVLYPYQQQYELGPAYYIHCPNNQHARAALF